MCGLAGFYSKSNNNREFVVGKMLDKMKHRGPDDRNIVSFNNLTLGHLRLSIIDIENGRQPMKSIDGRYNIIFNGAIYNYLELRQSLTQKGYKFRTWSDTEVLLNSYIEYGKDVMYHLNGMFSFAVYDKDEKRLFMARDHFGIKPMYYFSSPEIFCFASEIKAILQVPGVKCEIDEQSLHEYLVFQFVLKKHTFFKNVFKLEPATYLIVEEGKIVEKKTYWSQNYRINEEKKLEQFCNELLVLLENSITIQMRSDVPVGVYLSGGLDSSAVTILASKAYSGTLETFTGAFSESEIYDETKYAKIVSNSINGNYNSIYPKPLDFIEKFQFLSYIMDEPEAGPGLFPQYMVSQLASKKIKVILGGQGGDEIFGGYARYAIAYLEQCLKGAIFETQEEGKHIVTLHSIIQNLPLLKQYVPLIKKQFEKGLFDAMDTRYFNMIDRSPNLSQIYSDDVLKAKSQTAVFEKFNQIFHEPETTSYFNKMTYFDQKTLLPALLHVEDRMSMAASIESRVPLLDYRIVELASSIPPPMKFSGGKTKYILHQTLKNILPKQISERKDKMGFPTPINEWMRRELKEYVHDLFSSKKSKERGVFKTKNILTQIEGSDNFSRDMWGALNVEMWYRNFID